MFFLRGGSDEDDRQSIKQHQAQNVGVKPIKHFMQAMGSVQREIITKTQLFIA